MKNTKKVTVSIGVPVYNGAKFLFECLDSIQKQSFNDWECVVVDNQSTDNSYNIARQFEEKDQRFSVVKNEDFVPLADNWNNAFIHANQDAKYYKLLQADDWMYPEFLEKTVRLFEKDSSLGVISSYRLAETQVDGFGLDIYDGQIYDGRDILYKQLTRKLDISGDITTLIFSLEHLKKLDNYPKIFNGKFHIDTELFYDVCNISNVGFVFQVLSYTRRHPDSQTNTVVYKHNTFHQLNEAVLYRFKQKDKLLNRLYKKERLAYAYFYLLQKIRKSKPYQWHKKNIVRPFTFSEYTNSLLVHNPLSSTISRIINRIRKTLS